MRLDSRFGHHFPHGLLVDLLHPLMREFGIAFARLDRRMPQKVLHGNDRGPRFQEVRGKGMAQTLRCGKVARGTL